MLVSKNNLSQFNSYFKTLDVNKINSIFNAVGIEIEEVIKTKSPEGLVVGKILEISKVEGSKHSLNYCLVETAKEKLNIVCGAQNLKVNDYVVVAPIGTKFSDDFIIQKRKMLDVYSCGMICAYSEINADFAKFSDDYNQDKVIILDNDVNLKTNIYEYLGLNDEIYNLSLPSNRNDLNSIIALLNELNYQIDYNFKLNKKPFKFKVIKDQKISVNSDLVNAHCIGCFDVNENYQTPWNIKKFLINSQVNVQNTVADYANYITLLTGNPIHFYDADKIGNTLTIKQIDTEQKFVSLLDEEITIPANSLVSLDANDQIACLIGIIGANYSKITNETKKVIFEVINLNNDYLRELSEKIKIKNNSSELFSKPIPSIFINYSILFIKNIFDKNNFKVLSYKNKIVSKKIKYHPEAIKKYLGVDISIQKINSILKNTGFSILKNNIFVPPYRLDIANTFDLAEEVLKSLDINNIQESPILSPINFNESAINDEYQLENKLRDHLINLGLYDFKTMNLVSKNYTELFNFYHLDPYVISNPISSQREYYRTSLIPSLLETLKNNLNKKSNLFNFFEIQKIYSKNKNLNNLSIVITKPIVNNVVQTNLFLEQELTLCLNSIQKFLGINFNYKQANIKEFFGFNNEILIDEKHLGYFGKISKAVLKNFDLENYSVYVISLNLNELQLKEETFVFEKLSTLNPIYREITFKNTKDVDINEYINFIKQQKYVNDVKLEKIYIDKENNKFYTVSIKIVSDINLVNNELEAIFNHCINSLSKYGLELKK